MGKITVNDGSSSNTPYWDDPVAEEPEAEPVPAPKSPAKARQPKPVAEG